MTICPHCDFEYVGKGSCPSCGAANLNKGSDRGSLAQSGWQKARFIGLVVVFCMVMFALLSGGLVNCSKTMFNIGPRLYIGKDVSLFSVQDMVKDFEGKITPVRAAYTSFRQRPLDVYSFFTEYGFYYVNKSSGIKVHTRFSNLKAIRQLPVKPGLGQVAWEIIYTDSAEVKTQRLVLESIGMGVWTEGVKYMTVVTKYHANRIK